jgi:hypothetical protein
MHRLGVCVLVVTAFVVADIVCCAILLPAISTSGEFEVHVNWTYWYTHKYAFETSLVEYLIACLLRCALLIGGARRSAVSYTNI